MGRADFWQNQEAAQRVVTQVKQLKAWTEPIRLLDEKRDEAFVLFQLGEEENDAPALAEAEQEALAVRKELERLQFRLMLRGKDDARNAFVRIHAGAGGTESCDWAAMLLRMYTRWAERNQYAVRLVDTLAGDEAGLRRATLHVAGPWAYGHLQAEIGVHRLVRISPFDSRARRHTSFASVDVIPEVDDTITVELQDKDLDVQTYRSSSAGGQHVNKVETAVRMTHRPTGITVTCQDERSQSANKRTALKILRSRLYRLKEQEREDELARLYGEKGEIAWGNQIRSYVLQPYQMVKDHRTDHETSNVQAVLDGDLDALIEAYLMKKVGPS